MKFSKNTKIKKSAARDNRQKFILIAAVVTTLCAVFFAFKVVPHVSDLIAIRREQASLPNISPFDADWLEINPDYVGWITINGTTIRFPVVRGDDNVKYLTTTFRGEQNIVGAIFMDYRVSLDSPHVIIYGHQVQDQVRNYLMFSELHEFLNDEFLSAHPMIWFMYNNSLYEFEIFSARLTDIHDPAYQINFSDENSFATFLEKNNAPPDATQIITLSTCDGANNDRRMIVQGALIRTVPVAVHGDEETGWGIVPQ